MKSKWNIVLDVISSWDKLARMCRKCYCEYKTNKRKTDEKYKQSDILYKQKYKQSGRRKEVSKIRYETKKYEIIEKNKKITHLFF